MQIVNLFYELARQHKTIKAFFYNKSYEKGVGSELHPLIWLDDPIYGRESENIITYTCNVDILDIPKTDADVIRIQNECFVVGMELGEQIKKWQNNTLIRYRGYSFITLRDYYDNKACGVRFTYNVLQAIPVDICNESFDPTKEFEYSDYMNGFDTNNPNGCAVFSDKFDLPDFDIKEPNGCAIFK